MGRRFLLGLVVAAAALLPVACGGGSSGAAGGAAGIVPASAPLYVSINTDLEGDQLQQARALLDKFPGGEGALHSVEAELEQGGNVDFERDVRPALGPELDLVLLDIPQAGAQPDVVALLQPDDKAKLDALLAKNPGGEPSASREIDGWTAIASGSDVLDRFEQARGDESLADSDAFAQAMDGLPDDTLAKVYVDTSALVRSAASQSGAESQLRQLAGGEIPSVGAAATAEDNGLRLDASARTSQESETFTPELPAALPSGALLYAGFGDIAKNIRDSLNKAGEQNPQLDQQIAQLELALGLSLDQDVLPLFEHEGAVAVYPRLLGDGGTPGIVVALKVDDEAEAASVLDRLLARASQFMPGIPAPRSETVGGVGAKVVQIQPGTEILYAAIDGKLVVTNDRALLGKIATGGSSLADDAAFKQAEADADVPDEVNGLLYVDVQRVAGLALDHVERSSAAPQVEENLKPLQSLVLYGTQDGDQVKVSGFLAIK